MSRSELTKRALADALKKLLKDEPLGKITVTRIAEECGVHRQTFYYHFADVGELVAWIYTSEAEAALGDQRTYATWQEGFRSILDYLQDNREFVTRTFHSVDPALGRRYLDARTTRLIDSVVAEKAQGHDLAPEDEAFISHFYAAGFIDVVVRWIDGGMAESPASVTERLEKVVRGTFEEAIERLSGGPAA